MDQKILKLIPNGITINGVCFEAFYNSNDKNQVIFSNVGIAKALDISESSLNKILASNSFRLFCRTTTFTWIKTTTGIGSNAIHALTQSDLVLLISYLVKNEKYLVPISIYKAGFATIVQKSVDRVVENYQITPDDLQQDLIPKNRLNVRASYQSSYHEMEDSTFDRGYGVTQLCNLNRQISSLVVSDADKRREKSKDWRRNCSYSELIRLTIANQITSNAIKASETKDIFIHNFEIALQRSQKIYQIIDAPF